MATAVSSGTSTPTKRPAASRSQSQTIPSTAAKTPVYFAPTSHLDPSAYVRGTHAINIGSDVLIHPRTHLISIHSPLTISEGSIIAEKSIVGGPLPPASAETPTAPISTSTETPTIIGRFVHVHPAVTINAGAKISDFSIVESNVTIQHGVTVGEHSKICAGVTLSQDVPDWTVVYGPNGEQRRRRQKLPVAGKDSDGTTPAADAVEAARLRIMKAERDSTMAILKKSAVRVVAGRTKR